MTPQKEANELVEKFTNLYQGINLGFAKKHWAKQSALILVDKIIATIVCTPTDYGASWTYWMQVKTEIESI